MLDIFASDQTRHVMVSFIDKSYQKGKGTKAEQVEQIADAALEAMKQLLQYRPRLPFDRDEEWIIEYSCGHKLIERTETLAEAGIWPYCDRCETVCVVTLASPLEQAPIYR